MSGFEFAAKLNNKQPHGKERPKQNKRVIEEAACIQVLWVHNSISSSNVNLHPDNLVCYLVHIISLGKSIAMFCEFDITRSTTHKAHEPTISLHEIEDPGFMHQ